MSPRAARGDGPAPSPGSLLARFAAHARSGDRAALVTVTAAPDARRIGRKLLVADGAEPAGTLGDATLDAAAIVHAGELMWQERSELREEGDVQLFVDVVAPPGRVVLFGAVDLAAPLCRVARAAGLVPYVIDPRGAFATPERFPEAEEVVAAWPAEALERIGGIDRATAVCVLTHDPKLDDAALALALESDAAYIGAVGSRRAQADRRRRLQDAGIAEEAIDRVCGPSGLDLGAITPEETAVSIIAEVIAIRRGRTGGRLQDARGRIHDVPA